MISIWVISEAYHYLSGHGFCNSTWPYWIKLKIAFCWRAKSCLQNCLWKRGVVLAIRKENLHRLFNFFASSCVFPSDRKMYSKDKLLLLPNGAFLHLDCLVIQCHHHPLCHLFHELDFPLYHYSESVTCQKFEIQVKELGEGSNFLLPVISLDFWLQVLRDRYQPLLLALIRIFGYFV